MSTTRPNEPANKQLLRTNKSVLVLNRLSSVSYFLHEALLPGMSITAIKQSTPFQDAILAGYKMNFDDDFSVTFEVNQDLDNWRQITDWMMSISPTINSRQYADGLTKAGVTVQNQGEVTSDARMLLYTGQYAPTYEFVFEGVYPKRIGRLQFNMGESSILTCDVSFAYTSFRLESVS